MSALGIELPPLRLGEGRGPALPYTFACPGADPRGYAGIKFTLVSAGGNLVVATPTVTTSYDAVAGVGYIFVPITPAQSLALVPVATGNAWQLVLTDAGEPWLLADGYVRLVVPKAPIP